MTGGLLGIGQPARRVFETCAADVIAEDGDRAVVLADLGTIPGQARYW